MTDQTGQQILLHKRCRACKGDLEEVLNLGDLRLNAFPQHLHEIALIPKVPLILTVCTECGLAQLDRTVPPDWMYRTYHYRSGVNEMMREELRAIVAQAITLVDLAPDDKVLDIGANDGTLLSMYATSGAPPLFRMAYEPALNLQDRLRAHATHVIADYFPTPGVPQLQYKIITAIACAYDLEDPKAFFLGIADRLDPEGVAIIQFQDLEQQIQASAFDNICHEHLEYYSLWSLSHVLAGTGLMIQSCLPTPINGGSLRVILRPVGPWKGDPSVWQQLLRESTLGLDTPTIRGDDLRAFTRFRGKVKKVQSQIQTCVLMVTDQGRVLDVYGASTKGNILLQVLGIGPGQVRQAIDRSLEKVGRHTITGIPIVGEESARVNGAADVWLSPIWQFRESVLQREAWFIEQGGTIVFPLPYPEIVRKSWKA